MALFSAWQGATVNAQVRHGKRAAIKGLVADKK